jgi:uncharacterized membrane protein (UPF0127 family)
MNVVHRRWSIVNHTRGSLIADRAIVAAGLWQRARGLLGRPALAAGDALVLRGTTAIHTWGMQQVIDVVGIDEHGIVWYVAQMVRPGRIAVGAAPWRRFSMIELPAGQAGRSATCIADRLRIEPWDGGGQLRRAARLPEWTDARCASVGAQ